MFLFLLLQLAFSYLNAQINFKIPHISFNEDNFVTGEKISYDDEIMEFSSRSKDEYTYVEITLNTKDMGYVLLNGSSKSKSKKLLNRNIFKDKFEKIGDLCCYYDVVSYSSYDNIATVFAIGCVNIGGKYFLVYKKDRYKGENLEKELSTYYGIGEIDSSSIYDIINFFTLPVSYCGR